MKNYLLLFLLTLSISAFGQDTAVLEAPKVDERIEILSIVFRLADCYEYTANRFPKYVERIENHFGKHKEHELIQYIQKKVRKNGVGYDAVMCMAISITDTHPFQPLIPFSKEIPEQRWGKKKATTFLKLLNQFYQDADCEQFFNENKDLYMEASNRFAKVYNELNVDWYEQFYGEKPKGEFRIVNGLGNGGGNYGPNIVIDDKEIIYAIMGTWSVDSLGLPSYKVENYFPTLVHEFNHSFVNHVVEKYHTQLKQSGKTIFEPLEEKMNAQAYGSWQTMYAEAVVRAAVVKYLKDNDYEEDFVQSALVDELQRGFVWTEELLDELDRYDNNRTKYPNLESFMSEIVRFFDEKAPNIHGLLKTVEVRRPRVATIKPFINGSQMVDSSLKKIEIVFDKPLKGRGYSINKGTKGKDAFPKMTDISYSEDKKSVFIEINLQPNKEYQFVLTGRGFKIVEGYGMNNYEVTFKTK